MTNETQAQPAIAGHNGNARIYVHPPAQPKRSLFYRYLRFLWKLVVAFKDALVLLFLIIFFSALAVGLNVDSQKSVPAKVEGALYLGLNGYLVERVPPRGILDGLADEQMLTHSTYNVIEAIQAAGTDDRIKALVLDLDGILFGGRVNVNNVADALKMFKVTGKPIYAYSSFYIDDIYQFAVHADEIWLNPMGAVAFAGTGRSRLFYKDLIDALQINPHVFRVGTFKSAVEPYIRNDQSEAAREADLAVYQPLFENWLDHVKTARPQAQIGEFATDPVRFFEGNNKSLAEIALENKLVDKLGTWADFQAMIADEVGEASHNDAEKANFNHIGYADFNENRGDVQSGDVVTVIRVTGELVDDPSATDMAPGKPIANLIRQKLNDGDIKALVLRVDSPGGSVNASEEIRLALEEVREEGIPVVVSMANLAASGGYWISTASDYIFAEPDTITGSIGVFSVLPTFENSLKAVGVHTDGVHTTPLTGQPSFTGGLNPAANIFFQRGVESIYSKFLSIVANSRDLDMTKVAELAEGRVWTGGSAHQMGLIDSFGGLDDAVAKAAELAEIEGDFYPEFVDIEAQNIFFFPFEAAISLSSRLWNGDGDSGIRPTHNKVYGDIFRWVQVNNEHNMSMALRDMSSLLTRNGAQAYCAECSVMVPRKVQLTMEEKKKISTLAQFFAGGPAANAVP